jgi:hypothetical protein
MNPANNLPALHTRRHFFGRGATGIGVAALASLLNRANAETSHFAPRAKRVIYLFMSGGPSHIDLFDYKPKLKDLNGAELPASVRMGQRVTGMTAGQAKFPCAAPQFKFAQHGKVPGSANCCRTWPRSPMTSPS